GPARRRRAAPARAAGARGRPAKAGGPPRRRGPRRDRDARRRDLPPGHPPGRRPARRSAAGPPRSTAGRLPPRDSAGAPPGRGRRVEAAVRGAHDLVDLGDTAGAGPPGTAVVIGWYG